MSSSSPTTSSQKQPAAAGDEGEVVADSVETSSHSSSYNSVSLLEQMEIQNDDYDIPPLSSYIPFWVFWWNFAIWPVAFILLNFVVLGTLLTNWVVNPKIIRSNNMVLAVIYTVNSLVLYRAAVYVENDIVSRDAVESQREQYHQEEEGQGENGNGGEYDRNHVYAQVSRKIDRHLIGRSGRSTLRPPPRDSIFVGLLSVGAAICCAYGLRNFTTWVYMGTEQANKYCINPARARRDNMPPIAIAGIPDGLQDWAKKAQGYHRRYYVNGLYYVNGPAGDYVHMLDGTTFFAGTEPSNDTKPSDNNDDDFIYERNEPTSMRLLVSADVNGKVTPYKGVSSPLNLVSIKGDRWLASETFCCLYSGKDEMSPRSSSRANNQPKTKVMCHNSGEDTASSGFRNATVPSPPRNNRVGGGRWVQSTTAYAGEFWFLLKSYHSPGAFFEYFKVVPETTNLQLVSVANETQSDYSMKSPNSPCNSRIKLIQRIAISLVLFPVSFWLFKLRGMDAGVSPGCAAILGLIRYFSEDLALGLGILAIAAATVALLMGRPSRGKEREPLVWALYSAVVYLSLYGSTTGRVICIVTGVVAGILLNHPILQITGFVGGPLAVLVCLYKLIFGFRDDKRVFIIVTIVGGVIGGCGLVGMGSLLSKYRALFCFYLKQMWMKAARGGRTARRRRRHRGRAARGGGPSGAGYHPPQGPAAVPASAEEQEGDMTRRLID